MKQKTLDFLEAHKSEQPSTFTKDAKWRQENEVWLKQKENSEFSQNPPRILQNSWTDSKNLGEFSEILKVS